MRTDRGSDPDSLLNLASGSHGVDPPSWSTLLWEIVHSLPGIYDTEIPAETTTSSTKIVTNLKIVTERATSPLSVLPSPSPDLIALLLVVGKDGASVDGVDLLQRVVLAPGDGVLAAVEPWLTHPQNHLGVVGGCGQIISGCGLNSDLGGAGSLHGRLFPAVVHQVLHPGEGRLQVALSNQRPVSLGDGLVQLLSGSEGFKWSLASQ